MPVRSRLWLSGPKVAHNLGISGQESLRRLLYAPLTFLPFSNDSERLATIIASAIGYLEGFGVEDLETSVSISRDKNGNYVAHGQLILVPHHLQPQSMKRAVEETSPPTKRMIANTLISSSPTPPRVRLSQKLTITRVCPLNTQEDLNLGSMFQSPLRVDLSMDDMLKRIQSFDEARVALQAFAETGITISRRTLIRLLQQIGEDNPKYAIELANKYEFECDLTGYIYRLHSENATPRASALPATSHIQKRSRKSRLQRVREAQMLK